MVYRPSPPAVFKLNEDAWAILNACSDAGTDAKLIRAAYKAHAPTLSDEEVQTHVDDGIEYLLDAELIESSLA